MKSRYDKKASVKAPEKKAAQGVAAQVQAVRQGSKGAAHRREPEPPSGRAEADFSTVKAGLIDTMQQAIVVADREGLIQYVNDAFPEVLGYNSEEVIGKNPLMLCAGHQDRNMVKAVTDAVRHSGHWEGEVTVVSKEGETHPFWVCINAVRGRGGAISHYLGMIIDITALKQNEQRLLQMANYDMLTGLPNRSLMYDRLKQALSVSRRYGHSVAVMLLDIDRFKEVNDTLGHHVGDRLLTETAGRLMGCVRESDTIARMGGDEFLVILPEVGHPTNAAHLAQKFLEALSKPFALEGHDVYVSGSIGITLYPSDSDDMNMLIKNADTAMYHAKAQGKNNFKFFTEGINRSTVERFKLESRFRRALDKLEFHLNYQPKVDLTSGRICGMEALLRWYHPEQGSINPSLFIPLAEETGLVVPLGEWVLREACRQNRAWQDEGLPPLKVSVNLSARHFHRKNLLQMIVGILRETKLDPRYLMIEITESTIIQNVEETIKTLKKLRRIGIGVSIDDFGTGFSSLNYLNRFSLDELKIDKSFVTDIANNADSRKVVTAVIALAHNLNLSVVAEGVEKEDQVGFLKKSNCDAVQGYYFSVPLSSEDFRKMVAGGTTIVPLRRGEKNRKGTRKRRSQPLT